MIKEFKFRPGTYAKASEVVLKCKSSAFIEYGNENFTPTARQWGLNVIISINGKSDNFDINENLLKCFASSDFFKFWENSRYEQRNNGFCAVLANSKMHTFSKNDRPELERVDMHIQFHTRERVFSCAYDQLVVLCDYAFHCMTSNLRSIAPAAFSDKYLEIMALESLYRPIRSALHLEKSDERLQIATESGVLGGLSNAQPQWQYAGEFFSKVPFGIRSIIEIDEMLDSIHDAAFIDNFA